MLTAVLAGTVGAWIGLLACAYCFEHRLVFGRPRALRSAPAGPFDQHFVETVVLPRDGVLIEGVLARPVADALGANHSTAHTLIVWFGGRNEQVRWATAIASWLGPGHAVAAFAYRRAPRQSAVVADACHAIDWLLREPRCENARLVLAGRSLGSAVALQVAAALPPQVRLAGLVLVSPMDSIRDMVSSQPLFAPLARWMRNPFDSLAIASSVGCPVLVILAERDTRVPHERSLRLVDRLRGHCGVAGNGWVEVRWIEGTDHRSVVRSRGALNAVARFVDGLADAVAMRREPRSHRTRI